MTIEDKDLILTQLANQVLSLDERLGTTKEQLKCSESKLLQFVDLYENEIKKVELLEDENTTLVINNHELKLETETWDRISKKDDLIDMKHCANVLDYKGVGRNKLFSILREQGVIRPQPNTNPYQTHINNGNFKTKEIIIKIGMQERIYLKTFVTQKGIDYIRKILDSTGY